MAIAARNAEAYVTAALDGVARQTRKPDEVVFVDDASEDSTAHLAEEFARQAPYPVRIERLAERRGYIEACLHATRLCSADTIAFCDADDVWLDNKLDVCARELETSGATLVMHSTRVTDSALREVEWVWPAIEATRTVPSLALTGLDIDAPTMAMVCRAEVLRVADWPSRPASRYGLGRQMLIDEWIFFMAGVLGPIRLVAEPLLLYRRHDSHESAGPLDHKRKLTLRPVAANYRLAAEHTAACADYLESTRTSDAAVAERLAAGARHYRRAARHWQTRIALYDAGRRRRVRLLGRLLTGGAYGGRNAGGFGRAAFAKDLVAGVMLSLRAGDAPGGG